MIVQVIEQGLWRGRDKAAAFVLESETHAG
jgi:hypothetical protein